MVDSTYRRQLFKCAMRIATFCPLTIIRTQCSVTQYIWTRQTYTIINCPLPLKSHYSITKSISYTFKMHPMVLHGMSMMWLCTQIAHAWTVIRRKAYSLPARVRYGPVWEHQPCRSFGEQGPCSEEEWHQHTSSHWSHEGHVTWVCLNHRDSNWSVVDQSRPHPMWSHMHHVWCSRMCDVEHTYTCSCIYIMIVYHMLYTFHTLSEQQLYVIVCNSLPQASLLPRHTQLAYIPPYIEIVI